MAELLPRPALPPSPCRVLHVRRGDGPGRRRFRTAATFDVAAKGLGEPLELLEVVSGVSSDDLLVLGTERGALLAEALFEVVHRLLMRLFVRVELGLQRFPGVSFRTRAARASRIGVGDLVCLEAV